MMQEAWTHIYLTGSGLPSAVIAGTSIVGVEVNTGSSDSDCCLAGREFGCAMMAIVYVFIAEFEEKEAE